MVRLILVGEILCPDAPFVVLMLLTIQFHSLAELNSKKHGNSMCNNFHCCFSSEGFEDGQNVICLLDYSLLSNITLR